MQLEIAKKGLIHWLWDVLGGTQMRPARFGTPYTVSDSGVVIPSTDGGGVVSKIGGIYSDTTQFQWTGWNAPIISGDSANYATGSYTNLNSESIIEINSLSNGTDVQVFFTAKDGVVLEINEAYAKWPDHSKSYPDGIYGSAPESCSRIALAALDGYNWFNDDRFKLIADKITDTLKEYIDLAYNRPVLNDFNDGLFDKKRGGGFWHVVGSGGVLVNYSANSGYLTVEVDVSSNFAYALWGYTHALEIQDITSSNNFVFDFAGENNQSRYLITVQTSGGDKFYAGYADVSSGWLPYSMPTSSFLRKDQLVYDGDRQYATGWSTWGNGDSSGTIMEISNPSSEDNITRYFSKKLDWTLNSGTSRTFSITPLSTNTSSGRNGINLFIRSDVSTRQVRLRVRDAGDEDYIYDYLDVSTVANRITLVWSDFIKNPGYQPPSQDNNGILDHPIKSILFDVTSLTGTSGTFEIWDVRYDNPVDNLTDFPIVDTYQFDFDSNAIYKGRWDNVGFDLPPIVVTHGQVTLFSYQWNNEKIKDRWMGPAYPGYQGYFPIFQQQGETDIAQAHVNFLEAAQDAYVNSYGGGKGPFMPVYLTNLPENKQWGTLDTWVWDGPDASTGWGGFQYMALSGIARYYFLTGAADAKAILDNWMSYLDTRITQVSSGTYPKYETPDNFVRETNSYTMAYKPFYHGLIAEAMIFKYWRDGDAIANSWHRRLLDDLTQNRVATSGDITGAWSYSGGGINAYSNAQVGYTLGMLINGRNQGTINNSLSATSGDLIAFQNLYDFFMNNIDSQKPCALSPFLIPPFKYEDDVSEWLSISTESTTAMNFGSCFYFAVDYAKYTGDFIWLDALREFIWANLFDGESNYVLGNIDLKPNYDYRFAIRQNRNEIRTKSGQLYTYAKKTHKRFILPESAVDSEHVNKIRSWQSSGTTIKFYKGILESGNFDLVRVVGKDDPFAKFYKPYHPLLYEGTIVIETI